MPNKKHRTWVLLAAIAGLLGLMYWAFVAFRGASGPLPPSSMSNTKPTVGAPDGPAGGFALPVETARVVAADLALDATAVGSLRSNESVVLRPETAGRISSINFKDGSAVARGTLLVALDAAMQLAEFDQARANLGLAQVNLKRSRELFERKFVSQQALDNVEATLKVQEAGLALAQAKLEKMRIRAPFSGVVGIRNVSAGDYVKEGQELINIEDIGTLKIDFRLPEAYLGQLQPGQAVEVSTDALPGQKFAAVLDAVNPLVDTGGRAISCRAHLSNADGKLRPGMFVRVRLIFEQRSQVLLLPEQAIVPDMKTPFVFRVLEGKAIRVPVKTGLRRNAQVEIVEGLKADDEVVTAGQMKLRDGALVRTIGGQASAPAGTAK
ncbi:efflux RND transporter periplasmic adaptor subunit [Propionivibrio sp.]|uniref:efflux RND transporter periplasmic adaptor subunit n=1 Tax=Propionivibrio sp. TaxID=2212460 RepID=UPI00262D1AD6|nr:efflux RND transporter periplasmic adaptor subunit [Propionivibrio sp.]